MDVKEFRALAHQMVDWMADYYENIEQYPVKSQVKPGEIISQLPKEAPEQGEAFEAIFKDFNHIIMPGITHWQHPKFFAYFNANSSFPSILGEMATSALGAQCMSWQTSPAATELEERVMEWTRDLLGLPKTFTGVIQDTASTATLCALLSAREKYSDFAVNRRGFYNQKPFTVYCSAEAHSSVEKAAKIIGLGKENLRKIEVDDAFAMKPHTLEETIRKDKEAGFVPLAVVAAFGTTGSTAVDPVAEIGAVCNAHHLWLHVDAAYAGTALLVPEMRSKINGIELADSFVFNPHKWMFTNFDCSAYYVKDVSMLVRSLEILPEYLKTREGERVNNYRDWGVQLGRRFRALKLWFVIRSYGAQGLREKIQNHLTWAKELADTIKNTKHFELLAPVPFATVCFRFKPEHLDDKRDLERINDLNNRLMEQLNDSGTIYLTHTKLNGRFTLRLVVGQTNSTQRHIKEGWEQIVEYSNKLLNG